MFSLLKLEDRLKAHPKDGLFLWFRIFVAGILIFNLLHSAFAAERVVVAGTGDSQELLRILAGAFKKANPGIEVEVPDSIGSSGGVKAAAEGKCDLARVARAFKEPEKAYNLNYEIFAYSPVVFAVNSDSRWIDDLTREEILDIYSGKVILWSELGGRKKKIYAISRERGDSSLKVLEEKLAGWKEIKEFTGKIIYNTPETAQIIEKYKNTIAYLPLSMAKGRNLLILKIDGVYPSLENIINVRYDLLAPFAFAWKNKLSGPAKAFFDFVLSPQGQEIISDSGAVPVQLMKDNHVKVN